MSIDDVNRERTAKVDTSWRVLIEGCKSEISALQNRIRNLRKSLIYFEKEEKSGAVFPSKKVNKTRELS